MKRVWLIRHGKHDWLGKSLLGRRPGVHLNAEGRTQAESIVEMLEAEEISAVYSSPQARALETAVPLARECGLAVSIIRELDEIDFGVWTGCTFPELDSDPRWRVWNERRSTGRAPGGECMCEVQTRVVRTIERLARSKPVAFFTHGDVIRAALLHFMGKSLDEIHSFEVGPGEAVKVEITARGKGRLSWPRILVSAR